MDAVLLCDSTICRLCGEENNNGTNLYPSEENIEDLSELVNRYLPLKVEKDGKFPCTLCPGCTIQLEATKLFFDLIVDGQLKLRNILINQQDTLRRQEKQKQQLENALKAVNPNSSLQTYTVHADETGEKIFIQILSEGPLFPVDHEMTLKAEGLDKPKRKRGRPPKPAPRTETDNVEEIVKENEVEAEVDADGKRKRRIKKPSRYSELLQGKELDRVFREEGVLDDEESASDTESKINFNSEIDIKAEEAEEIIGHMESKLGEVLGNLVVKNKIRTKTKHEQGRRREKYECEFCARVFLHSGRLEIHKSFHKNIKYQCGIKECLLEFDTKVSLEEHQRDVGHTGTTFIENVENYGQVELPQLLTPADEELVDEPTSPPESPTISAIKEETIDTETAKLDIKFTCSVCEKNFSCKQNYEIHMKAVHENQKPYSCEKCDKKFPYITSLKCHMLQHTDKSYPCESCEKVFNHPSSLVYHREAEHNNGRKFVCNKCKKTFKHKQLLLRHQLVHTDERPHVCKSCEATFKTRANLLNHMPTHTGERKYYCSQCGQTFAHKTSLTLHVRWHNGQKPYECDVCMKTFSQKGNLAEHRRIHTGEKPYTCSFCGRKFTTSSQYKLHVKRHTGERPWRCEYCSKTFLHKDTWKCHTRRHRNERPFQCQECLRGFTEHWALRKHERLHTGEKPYICDICSKSFADSSNLTKHKKIHFNVTNKASKETPNIQVVTESADGQNSNQIVYLTYQDGNSNDENPQTLVHIVDSMREAQEDSNILDKTLDNTLFAEEDTEMETDTIMDTNLDVQLQQLIDNEGNAISLTTTDGQQMKVVTSMTDDEQSIQGLMPDGTLVPINLTMENGKLISAEVIEREEIENENLDDIKAEEKNDLFGVNENILQESKETIDFLADGESKMEFLNGENKDNETIPNKIQFLTEDGQNVCFITTYDIENTTINNQYVTEM